MILFAILVMSIIIGLMFYVNGKGLLYFINIFFTINLKDYWITFSLVNLLFISLLFFQNKYAHIINGYWMAISAYLFMFSLLAPIIKLLPLGTNAIKIIDISKIVLTLLIVIIGMFNVKNLKVTNYSIKTDKISEDLNVVLFSDTHLGHQIGYDTIAKIVKKVNAENPDIVFIPGDIFNTDMKNIKDLEKVTDELSKIKAKYGVFATLGNHDGYKGNDDIRIFLAKSDIILLQDEVYITDNLVIIGRLDARPIERKLTDYNRKSIEELIADIDTEKFTILLDHQPSDTDNAIKNNIDLTLSGHTHNGQIFPGSLITNSIFKVGYGHQKFDNTNVVVTSGAGFWGPPIRVGTKSEIVSIKITQ